MNCKFCGKHLLRTQPETCSRCDKEVARIAELKSEYKGRRLNGYELKYAILDLRREKLNLKTIAFILDKPIHHIITAWEIILQDGQ